MASITAEGGKVFCAGGLGWGRDLSLVMAGSMGRGERAGPGPPTGPGALVNLRGLHPEPLGADRCADMHRAHTDTHTQVSPIYIQTYTQIYTHTCIHMHTNTHDSHTNIPCAYTSTNPTQSSPFLFFDSCQVTCFLCAYRHDLL